MMTEELFTERIRRNIEEEIGGEATVIVQKVCKNNGVMLDGLSIFQKEINLSPTIYLEGYYKQYLAGEAPEEIVREIIACYREYCPVNGFNAEFFMDYGRVRKRLAYRLVSREKNEKMLEDVPYFPYLDLAVVFFCGVESDEIGCGSIQIKNEHLRFWGIEPKQLFADAENNMKALYPEKVCTMRELFCSVEEGENLFERELAESGHAEEIPMYVMTNAQRAYGAAVILYQGVLEELAERLMSDLAILPSSIHEMIVVPVQDEKEAGDMLPMVREINATQVGPEEVLADSVYYYARSDNNLTVIH